MKSSKFCCAVLLVSLILAGRIAAAEVVAVVSVKSPVTTLSKNQVADIFLGKSNRFPEGGPAMPIDQAEGSALRDEFYAVLVGKSSAQMKAHWSKIIFTGRGQPPREVPNSIEVKNLVANNPNAIGYIELSQLDSSLRVVFQNPARP